jgi:hypothetical protein
LVGASLIGVTFAVALEDRATRCFVPGEFIDRFISVDFAYFPLIVHYGLNKGVTVYHDIIVFREYLQLAFDYGDGVRVRPP